MRISFTRAGYALAAGVAVTAMLGIGMSAASASTSGNPVTGITNATNACGKTCNDIFNQGLGTKQIPTTNGRYGNRVHLTRAHNFLVTQDFIADQVGTLADFCSKFGGDNQIPATSYACINYPSGWPVYEEQFAPASFLSPWCAGVGVFSVRPNGLITLRTCGDSARTLWVADLKNAVKDKRSLLGFDVPLVNGASSSFSNPLVLTTDDSGTLTLQELMKNGLTQKVFDSQEWGLKLGPAF
jgi:hypothetical protein